MKKEHKNVNEIADWLIKKLIENNFTIQRYDAISSNSIYLKLDYGVCNSIRISDHNGKKHLSYRYNIGPHISEYKLTKKPYDKHFYKSNKYVNLLAQIIKDRDFKIERYGANKYTYYMNVNKNENGNNSGFWRNATLINERK